MHRRDDLLEADDVRYGPIEAGAGEARQVLDVGAAADENPDVRSAAEVSIEGSTQPRSKLLARIGRSDPFSQLREMAMEAPGAYKDVTEVVEAADHAGLARIVARLEPMVCIKG